jgi:hypothetical protein
MAGEISSGASVGEQNTANNFETEGHYGEAIDTFKNLEGVDGQFS